MSDIGYLQHGAGASGPFRTESVPIRHIMPDEWQARFEGKWRKVHTTVRRLFITYRGEKITITVEGV